MQRWLKEKHSYLQVCVGSGGPVLCPPPKDAFFLLMDTAVLYAGGLEYMDAIQSCVLAD